MNQSASSSLKFLSLVQTKNFPYKLHDMLQYAERNGLDSIISWTPGGKAFCVHKHELFCKKILKIAFSHSSYKSFEKQLKNWSFQSYHSETGRVYSNPNFMRGRKSLCIEMSNKNTKTKYDNAPRKADFVATMAASNNISGKGEPESTKIMSLLSTTDILKTQLLRREEEIMLAKNKKFETSHTAAAISTTPTASLRALLLKKKSNDTVGKKSTLLPTNVPYEEAAISTVGQKIPWEMTCIPPSSDLISALRKKSQITDYTGEFVQRHDSGITSCLRRPKDRRPSSENLAGALRNNQAGARNTLHGKIASRLLRPASQDSSYPGPFFNGISAKLSIPRDIDSGRLSNYNHSTPASHLNDPLSAPPGSTEASYLLRMAATLEEEKKKQLIAMISNRCIVGSANLDYNGSNIANSRTKQFLSTLPNAFKTFNMVDTFDFEEKRKMETQALLDQLELERELKTLQFLFEERQRKSALLHQQQKAATLTNKSRDQTLSALLALRSQRPPPS